MVEVGLPLAETLKAMRAGWLLSLVRNRIDSVSLSKCQGLAPEPAQPLPSFCTWLSTTRLPPDSTLETCAWSDPGAPLYWMRTREKGRGSGRSRLMAHLAAMADITERCLGHPRLFNSHRQRQGVRRHHRPVSAKGGAVVQREA